MRRFSGNGRWRERGGAIVIISSLGLLLVLLPILLLTNQSPTPTPTPPVSPTLTTQATTTPEPPPTPSPAPTPTPTLIPRAARLDPRHGIHAPIGYQWTNPLRQSLVAFRDRNGQPGAPGLVVALSSDMRADNNTARASLEEDLHQYERQGSQIYVRMYPQRFPGGFTEANHTEDSPNTISGSPQDAAQDIFSFVAEQQKRNGWHFSQIIPGNEPDLEWPNELYAQNLLPWQSNGDPAKYAVMNEFYLALYDAWQTRLAQPDAAPFRDVVLYFPPLAQDATPGPDFYAGFYYYDGGRPVGNRYDGLRAAVERYRRFSWHNYFQPGRACLDVAANAFPDWLKADLESGWPALIGEAGWSPTSLALPAQNDSRARLTRFWRLLGIKWETRLYEDDRPQWRTQDDTIDGATFDADLARFVNNCQVGSLKRIEPVGVAVWLAGSDGNFIAALGVEPGSSGVIRTWLQRYAALPL